MTNCPNCGAPVRRGYFKCEYCGTPFDDENGDCIVLYADNEPIAFVTREQHQELHDPFRRFKELYSNAFKVMRRSHHRVRNKKQKD